ASDAGVGGELPTAGWVDGGGACDGAFFANDTAGISSLISRTSSISFSFRFSLFTFCYYSCFCYVCVLSFQLSFSFRINYFENRCLFSCSACHTSQWPCQDGLRGRGKTYPPSAPHAL